MINAEKSPSLSAFSLSLSFEQKVFLFTAIFVCPFLKLCQVSTLRVSGGHTDRAKWSVNVYVRNASTTIRVANVWKYRALGQPRLPAGFYMYGTACRQR